MNMARSKWKEINVTLQLENFKELDYRAGLHVSLRQENNIKF